jgi:hypothetical protein
MVARVNNVAQVFQRFKDFAAILTGLAQIHGHRHPKGQGAMLIRVQLYHGYSQIVVAHAVTIAFCGTT